MTSVVREKYDSLFKQGICPIARWGNPEDIGNAVSILCSGKLKYSTGQVIDCLLYTSDAADDLLCVDLGRRLITKKKKKSKKNEAPKSPKN